HYTIPFFIPEMACIGNCIYCNQKKITSRVSAPEIDEMHQSIEEHLASFKHKDAEVEVGFFGGSFSGLCKELQETYLKQIQKYIAAKRVKSIRISTRPDMIDKEELNFLKHNKVQAIELGVQSFDKDVLEKSGRGHSLEDSYAAAKLIKEEGFELGLQMMIGLPGDTIDKAIFTAEEIIRLGAATTRIYPLLVIKDSLLAEMYQKKEYTPLSIEQSLNYLTQLIPLFEKAGIKILRVGLHQSEDLNDGEALLAGPYHPSLKELALSRIWHKQLQKIPQQKKEDEKIIIEVNPSEINYAIGYHAANKKNLLQYFSEVKFISNTALKERNYHVRYSR
ncbi:MAG TPA: radical SAM protein, partial [Bacteroidetes bacterium]|nr:radical SAM protein [Bacteroidota bacterium]